MKRTWTIIGVRQVSTSFRWYQTLLGPRTGTLEFALRDPDGYCVMMSALSAD